MMRNIAGQALYQLGLLFFLLFKGAELWGLHPGNYCLRWYQGVERSLSYTFQYNGQRWVGGILVY